MDTQTPKAKASKGSVKIKVSNNRLQLVFSCGGKRHYLSLGLSDSQTHRKLAEMKVRAIELDIVSDNFDQTLEKYKPQFTRSSITPITPTPPNLPSLDHLWEQYVEFKRPSVSPNYLAKELGTAERVINNQLPTRSLEDAVQIRDWVVAHKPANAAKRLITQLSSCCDWATKSNLIEVNPFSGMAKELKLPKNGKKQQIDPFTQQERNQIIQAFTANQYYGHYGPFVSFLFKTGCRPSEAIALQWKHIAPDFQLIIFEQSAIDTEYGLKMRKGLKTQERRQFPCNTSLRDLLITHQPSDCEPELLVFPSPGGKLIDFHNFRNRAWKTILGNLKEIRYRKPYQTRHTFITLALENGLDAKDVAGLVGNSPEIIYKHYAGTKRELVVPEF
ncbi:site-specific integrase [Acaryochloris marina]|uniref:Phage integrase n=1 Tax=Acaryochloris marina (strain MBIC 11017) TaxID=329726 RepID=B0C0F4_ACAM1|nr:site-specific integrase [Acaryochloris marina]ABW30747.1 phage integrase [Acaryochloris marina MBIC11017]BDM79522.1 site-specific integrase [Acaryochloris marina MBIC10699]